MVVSHLRLLYYVFLCALLLIVDACTLFKNKNEKNSKETSQAHAVSENGVPKNNSTAEDNDPSKLFAFNLNPVNSDALTVSDPLVLIRDDVGVQILQFDFKGVLKGHANASAINGNELSAEEIENLKYMPDYGLFKLCHEKGLCLDGTGWSQEIPIPPEWGDGKITLTVTGCLYPQRSLGRVNCSEEKKSVLQVKSTTNLERYAWFSQIFQINLQYQAISDDLSLSAKDYLARRSKKEVSQLDDKEAVFYKAAVALSTRQKDFASIFSSLGFDAIGSQIQDQKMNEEKNIEKQSKDFLKLEDTTEQTSAAEASVAPTDTAEDAKPWYKDPKIANYIVLGTCVAYVAAATSVSGILLFDHYMIKKPRFGGDLLRTLDNKLISKRSLGPIMEKLLGKEVAKDASKLAKIMQHANINMSESKLQYVDDVTREIKFVHVDDIALKAIKADANVGLSMKTRTAMKGTVKRLINNIMFPVMAVATIIAAYAALSLTDEDPFILKLTEVGTKLISLREQEEKLREQLSLF